MADLGVIVKAIGIEPYYQEDAGVIYCADCLDILPKMPEKCVDLIVTDPPYNIGIDKWDRRADYVPWLTTAIVQCDQVLCDTGSLWFSHMKFPALAAIHIGIELKTSLRHIQFITIDKGIGSIAGRTSENLRSFPRASEYYQWYGHDDPTGAERLSGEISARNPTALYLAEEITRSGRTRKELAILFPSKTGGVTGCVSNWLLGYNFPTAEQYQTMRDYLNREGEYDYLRREYDYLRREYDYLRRSFNLPMGVTDVWQLNFSDGANKGHCTEKPLELIKRIIAACSDSGDLIVDCFAGSGTTGVAAKELNRPYLLIEISQKYCDIAVQRLAQEILL